MFPPSYAPIFPPPAWPPSEWFIERVPADTRLAGRLEDLRQLQRAGWDVHALLAPNQRTVVLLGCRP